MRIYTTLGPFAEEIRQGEITDGSALQNRVTAAGFDGFEFGLGVLNHPGGRRLLEGLDFTRVTFHSNHFEFSLGSANPYRRKAAIQQLRDEIDLAVANAVSVLTFHPGFEGKRIPREESHRIVIDSLGEVLSTHGGILKGSLTTLALENMDKNLEKLFRTADELEFALTEIPDLGMTCDLAHCALNQFDISKFIDRVGKWIRHIHISGYKAGLPHSKVSLKESEVDFSNFVQRLTSPTMVFVIENGTLPLAHESRMFLESLRNSS